MRDSSAGGTVARQGFEAWRRGDFDALEQVFAPQVQYRTEAEALAAAG